jgi:methionyl-tRNA synthetase
VELIESDQLKITPKFRKREVLAFTQKGLNDISFSRDKQRSAGWGITVPDEPEQIIYVWIDALINYLSGLGPDWRERWNGFERICHLTGKNVWKFHAIYWPAILVIGYRFSYLTLRLDFSITSQVSLKNRHIFFKKLKSNRLGF